MDTADHIAALRREGTRLGDVASGSPLDAPVPTCPGWTVRDLVLHMGDVHRWAAAHVAERRTEPIRRAEEVAGPWPGDETLLDWFREGHAALIQTLETADPDVECWSFLPAPSPLAFWARRQAHETTIHRADAEASRGAVSAVAPEFAVDGVEELLFGFFRARDDASQDGPERTMLLEATDAEATWLVPVGSAGGASRGRGPADCIVRAPASDLYLLLWNRRTAEGLDVQGDDAPLRRWREEAQITWGRGRSNGQLR